MPYTREPLSGSTHGRGILLTGTNSAGAVTLHTAQASTTLVDVVTLYASNFGTTNIYVSIEWGGTTSPNDILTFDVAPKATTCLVSDLPIRNSLVVEGFASVANLVSIFGFVNVES